MTNLQLAKQFIREVIIGGESADAIEMFAEWLDKRAHEPTVQLPEGNGCSHPAFEKHGDTYECTHCDVILQRMELRSSVKIDELHRSIGERLDQGFPQKSSAPQCSCGSPTMTHDVACPLWHGNV